MSLYSGFKSFLLIPLFGGLGIIIGMIVEGLFDRGIILDEYIVGTITIADIKFYIILISVILGIFIAYMQRK